MQRLSKKLSKQLMKIENNSQDSTSPTLSIVQGRNNVYSKIAKLINDAQNNVYLVSTLDDLKRMHYTIISDALKNAKERDIKITIMSNFNNSQLSILQRLNPSFIGNVKLPSQGRIIVEKNNELLMSGSTDSMKNSEPHFDSMLYTNSEEMSKNIFSLCDLLWRKSSKLQDISVSI